MSSEHSESEAPGADSDEVTPGKAAHDTWCPHDDWDELDDETRQVWEDAARDADAAQAAVDQNGER